MQEIIITVKVSNFWSHNEAGKINDAGANFAESDVREKLCIKQDNDNPGSLAKQKKLS